MKHLVLSACIWIGGFWSFQLISSSGFCFSVLDFSHVLAHSWSSFGTTDTFLCLHISDRLFGSVSGTWHPAVLSVSLCSIDWHWLSPPRERGSAGAKENDCWETNLIPDLASLCLNEGRREWKKESVFISLPWLFVPGRVSRGPSGRWEYLRPVDQHIVKQRIKQWGNLHRLYKGVMRLVSCFLL